jgi:hypothetical protein
MIHSEIKPMREWAVVLLFNVTKVLGDECRAVVETTMDPNYRTLRQ